MTTIDPAERRLCLPRRRERPLSCSYNELTVEYSRERALSLLGGPALNETDDVDAKRANDEALFLVELSGSERPRYAICQQIIIVDPDRADNDVPWHELAALFRGETLRAVPMPGRVAGGLQARRREAGVSTEPGVSTVIEVNLLKIERKD